MSYRQHKTGYKKSLWEQEEFNQSYSEEYNQARYSRSYPTVAHTVYLGVPRWTDKVATFYSYNNALAVDGGYRRDQMPEKSLDNGCKDGAVECSYSKVDRKDAHVVFVFGAANGGDEKTINVHGQKRRVFGNSVYPDYFDYSDTDSD